MRHLLMTIGPIAALAMLGAVAFVAPTRTAGATASGAPTFARPDFTGAAADTRLHLDRFAALGQLDAIAGFADDPKACLAALKLADAPFTAIAAIRTGKGCGVEDAVLASAGRLSQPNREKLEMTCAMAARLYLWERTIVAPAAEKHFGVALESVEALGAFSCRTIAGYDKMSEHAFGKAADISGFRLADGRTVSVLKSWSSKGAEGRFLREIHGRACDLFDVTLGPDYDADHANHFHLDVGGNAACR